MTDIQKGKKFISPGAWFSMIYPSGWNEFEDGENSFLFYDPNVWNGNFRISAYRKELTEREAGKFGEEFIRQELKDNTSAKLVKVGTLDCAYSKEMFQEEGEYFVTHLWITGIEHVAFECTFTVARGGSTEPAEKIITTLAIRKEGVKYPPEIIPVRLSEIFQIDEAFDWVAQTAKKQLKKDFQGLEEDLPKLQQVMDNGEFNRKKRDPWIAFGIALCTILSNEIEDMEWMTLIDGNREDPVLQYTVTGKVIDPMKLVWSKIKAGETCNITEEYKHIVENL